MNRRSALLVGLAIAAICGAETSGAQQVFRVAVDLIAVDVQVVDSDGRPITTLDRSMFEVTIDGKKRPVVSADLLRASEAADMDSLTPLGSGAGMNNQPPDAGTGRMFVLAIDAVSFAPGDSLRVGNAARAFIRALQANDRVGVFTLHPFGPRIDPTTDRGAVARVLDRVAGQRPSVQGRFNLSVPEIIDISSEDRTRAPSAPAVTQPGAARGTPVMFAVEANTLQSVQLRECRSTTDVGCLEAIVGEANVLARDLETRTTQSLLGIADLLDTLREYSGRKTVIVLSGGMTVSDRPGARLNVDREARDLGEEAAHAGATIYALHIDAGMMSNFSAQSRRVRDPSSASRTRWLGAQVLEEFSDASGGLLLRSNADSGEMALERVLRETSAYYLLGVDPSSTNRDGRAHRLRVKVSRPGASVRSRQWVVLKAR